MADTLEKRVRDVEIMLAHMPEDLDARFAGVDVKLAGIRETLALHTTRFTKIEGLIAQVDGRVSRIEGLVTQLDGRVSRLEGVVSERFARIDERFARIDERFTSIDRRLDTLAEGMAQILERLPPRT
jgi:C4-type Zn-finger protein